MELVNRWLALALIIAIGIIAALVAAWLKWADGASVPGSILYGFVGFGSTVGLVLAVIAGFRSFGSRRPE